MAAVADLPIVKKTNTRSGGDGQKKKEVKPADDNKDKVKAKSKV